MGVLQMIKKLNLMGKHTFVQGFTLLEMMVSIFILALVLISIFKMQSGTIRLSSSGEFYSTASHLARQKLTDLTQDLEEKSSEGDASGDFGENFPGYRWYYTIESPGLADAQLPEKMVSTVEVMMGKNLIKRFKKIDLEISHANGNSFHLYTWRFLNNEQK